MPAPRSEVRTLNGLGHHLLHWDAQGPTLVLLHGFLDLSWSFAPFADAMQQRASVYIVAPDLRGHGASEWVAPGGYYHFPDYISDMHALLTALPRPLCLLGHSMGGTIALLLAGAFPDIVDRLILVEGLGPPPDHDTPPERVAQWIREVNTRRREPVKPMASVDVAKARLMANNSRMPEELATLLAEHGTRHTPQGVVWSFDPLHRTRSPMPFQVEQLRTFLRGITAPTLLVDGAESGFAEFIDADGRASDIKGAIRATIPDAGHMVHQDQPEALANVVARFVRGQAG